jgi:transcription elongation factor GreB
MNEEDEFDESADDEDIETVGAPGGTLKNYITPSGLKKIKAEYHQLFHNERPKLVETISWAASNGDRSENGDYIYGKRRLREIDRRLRFLGRRLAAAVLVEVSTQAKDTVLFGARVTVEDEKSKPLVYHIVGEDEIDVEKRKISWVSPVAKALMNAKLGDSVVVSRPNGEIELKIIKTEYLSEE